MRNVAAFADEKSTTITASMSELLFGVYGFEFTRQMAVDGIWLEPLFAHKEAAARANDKESLRLTGLGRIASTSKDGWEEWQRVHLLASAMTFAQQQHVTVSRLIRLSPGDSVESLCGADRLDRPIPLMDDRVSFGAAVLSDVWSPDSMADLLTAIVKRFRVEVPDDALRLAFFRQLEISRVANRFLEIHHFFAFLVLSFLQGARDRERTARTAQSRSLISLRRTGSQYAKTKSRLGRAQETPLSTAAF